MNILLIGYGKMGKAIEGIAAKRGHTICGKIDVTNFQDIKNYHSQNTDVAIEFTHPEAAVRNLIYCIENHIPVVCGTTGWLEKLDEIKTLCATHEGSMCYSSNYSIGVNIFWAVNEKLAQLMDKHPDYDVTLEEIHHVYKKDAPSGTAITTAEGILNHLDRKQAWTIDTETLNPTHLHIAHKREHNVPGTHTVLYTGSVDSIALTHTAFNREGFATGAVVAAEYIADKTGFFSMKDVLSI